MSDEAAVKVTRCKHCGLAASEAFERAMGTYCPKTESGIHEMQSMTGEPPPDRPEAVERVCRYCGMTPREAQEASMLMYCKANPRTTHDFSIGPVHVREVFTGDESATEAAAPLCRCGHEKLGHMAASGKMARCGAMVEVLSGMAPVGSRPERQACACQEFTPATGEPSPVKPEVAEARRDQSVDLEAELSRAERLVAAASELPQFDGVPLLQRAQVLAEISQAKELKRIADILERWVP